MLRTLRSSLSFDNVLPLLAVAMALSWVWSTVGVMQHNFEFQRQVDELRQQNTLMEIENKTLEYRIAYYKTQEYAEISARENLNRAAPGEKLVVVPPSPYEHQDTSVLTAGNTAAQPARSNFQQWMYFLFGQHRKEVQS